MYMRILENPPLTVAYPLLNNISGGHTERLALMHLNNWIVRRSKVYLSESLILAQDERWRRA